MWMCYEGLHLWSLQQGRDYDGVCSVPCTVDHSAQRLDSVTAISSWVAREVRWERWVKGGTVELTALAHYEAGVGALTSTRGTAEEHELHRTLSTTRRQCHTANLSTELVRSTSRGITSFSPCFSVTSARTSPNSTWGSGHYSFERSWLWVFRRVIAPPQCSL